MNSGKLTVVLAIVFVAIMWAALHLLSSGREEMDKATYKAWVKYTGNTKKLTFYDWHVLHTQCFLRRLENENSNRIRE